MATITLPLLVVTTADPHLHLVTTVTILPRRLLVEGNLMTHGEDRRLATNPALATILTLMFLLLGTRHAMLRLLETTMIGTTGGHLLLATGMLLTLRLQPGQDRHLRDQETILSDLRHATTHPLRNTVAGCLPLLRRALLTTLPVAEVPSLLASDVVLKAHRSVLLLGMTPMLRVLLGHPTAAAQVAMPMDILAARLQEAVLETTLPLAPGMRILVTDGREQGYATSPSI